MDKPSAYTPFLRRWFGNERQRELDATEELFRFVASQQAAFEYTLDSFQGTLSYAFNRELDEEKAEPFVRAAQKLAKQEGQIWDLPPPDFHKMDLKEFTEYRSALGQKQHFFANSAELMETFYRTLFDTLFDIAQELPELEDPSPFTVPLVFALEHPRECVDHIFNRFGAAAERGLFASVSEQLYRNICIASGREPGGQESGKRLIAPSDSKLPLDELVSVYLGRTPFFELFMSPVPLKLTNQDRFSHWHVLAGSGHGKTTLIERIIRYDLESDDPPSIVLIDPHSDLVRKLVRSDLGIGDKLMLIDPRDTKFPVSLNPFAVNRERLAAYDEVTREQVTAGVIETMLYLFNGLTNLALTGKQEVFFRYVTRLMLMLPEAEQRNATILDVLNLMRDPEPYQKAIDLLPEIPRDFFMNDFRSKTYEQTKDQIRYRLQAQIESPTMARLFTSNDTIDLYSALNRGSVVLVDTATDFLKKDGSAAFGKLMISLVLQAVMERAAIPEGQRKPTFVFIDEAGSFFSSNVDDLLTQARKYNAGLILSHQYLDQATSSLKASLSANTAIKFAGGLSANDAGAMARDMRTTTDHILEQPKLHFAAHVRGVTPTAVTIPLELPTDQRLLSDQDLSVLIDRNRQRVCLSAPQLGSSPSTSPQETDERLSPEW